MVGRLGQKFSTTASLANLISQKRQEFRALTSTVRWLYTNKYSSVHCQLTAVTENYLYFHSFSLCILLHLRPRAGQFAVGHQIKSRLRIPELGGKGLTHSASRLHSRLSSSWGGGAILSSRASCIYSTTKEPRPSHSRLVAPTAMSFLRQEPPAASFAVLKRDTYPVAQSLCRETSNASRDPSR